MKFSMYAVVAFLAAAVAAEGLDAREADIDFSDEAIFERAVAGTPKKCDKVAKGIPKCARPGITSCTVAAGCGRRNYTCGCKHQQQITNCATPKVLKACSQADALKARKAAAKLCKCAG